MSWIYLAYTTGAVVFVTASGGLLHSYVQRATERVSLDRKAMKSLAQQCREIKNEQESIANLWNKALSQVPLAMSKCARCNIDHSGDTSLCHACKEWCKTVIGTVTDFDADMPCPYCHTEGPHFLREAHPRPVSLSPQLRAEWGAVLRGSEKLRTGYTNYVRANADMVVEAFGEREPVKVYINDAATEAYARAIRPIKVGGSVDKLKHSKYDHPDAKTIRTCTNCAKEWSQK